MTAVYRTSRHCRDVFCVCMYVYTCVAAEQKGGHGWG